MNERLHDRDRERAARGGSLDGAVPGRSSASAALSSSAQPTWSGIVMRKANGDGGADSGDAIAAASSSTGAGLPSDLRDRFEGSLDTDLGDVRIHTGEASAHAADSVAARAYTIGNDIHFGRDQYDPHSQPGQALIAHEVAHTVQQRGAAPARQNKLAVSQPGDALEHEADTAAAAMVAGAPTTVSSGGGGAIARKEEKNPIKPGEANTKKLDWKEKTVELKLWGKSAKFQLTEHGVNGSLALGKHEASAELAKGEATYPVQLSPGVGVMLRVKGDVKCEATGEVKLTGGVKENAAPQLPGYEAMVVGSGSVGFTVSGRLEVLPYVGVAFANLNGGGFVTLSGSATSSVGVSGGMVIDASGKTSGVAGLEVNNELKVTGTGGITIGYEALIARGTLYETTLASHDFCKAGIKVSPKYDFATGVVTGDKPEITSLQWIMPTLGETRERTDGAGGASGSDGSRGSGSGPATPSPDDSGSGGAGGAGGSGPVSGGEDGAGGGT